MWCGVRLSRSSSSNAGRGRDYRGHTDKLQHDCTLTHTHTHTHTEDTEGTQAEALCLSVSLSLSLSVSHRVTCLVHVLETVRLLELTGKISRQRGGKETDERGQPDDLSRHKRSMCQLSMCS